jgi:FkbM family methyltransferase
MTNDSNLNKFINISKSFLGKKNLVVFELGARDASETLGFNELLENPEIYSFECNPATIPLCREKIQPYKNIHLIEKAVSEVNGKIKFYQIDQEKTVTTWKDGNPGASSLFPSSGKYPIEKYVQNEIQVEVISLKNFIESYKINHIDLLWMDIQGAELNALKGLGEYIEKVKIIHLELEFFEIYKNQPLFWEVKSFLNKNGFYLIGFTSFEKYACDGIFINKNLLRNQKEVIKYWITDATIYYMERLSRKLNLL